MPHKKKLGELGSGDLGGYIPLEIMRSSMKLVRTDIYLDVLTFTDL